MEKDEIVKVLLNNGFKRNVWFSTVDDRARLEYVPIYDEVEIYFNDYDIEVRTTNQDTKIRFFNNQILFLSNYQDYCGGWYKNCMKINMKIIKDMKIMKCNIKC